MKTVVQLPEINGLVANKKRREERFKEQVAVTMVNMLKGACG